MSVPKQERRRRRLHDEGEEVVPENPTLVTRSSECESEDEGQIIELSEHESAVDDSADQEDETEEGSETETEEGSETEEETGSETEGYTDEEGLEEERQSGDGEEQPNNDKPDDDEDKKNPAYVPRKGAFYEHDFRRGGEGPEVEVTEEAKPKKKLWQDEGKWSHDRYIDELQAPKTRQELIDMYGYDIRSCDRPPEAPPRRTPRSKGPRKQNFNDFLPRMAVIDTTDGGQDSIPNLGDDDFIQYKKSGGRNNQRSPMQNADYRRGGRGGGRGSFRGSDIETMNNRNRPNSSKPIIEIQRNVEVSAEYIQAEDFPNLQESARHNVAKEATGWKKEDADRLRNDTKPFHFESHNNNQRNDSQRNGNRDRFPQSQDIRKQENLKGKNRSAYGFREEKREVFNNGKGSQAENWRTVPHDFRDGYKGDDHSRGGNNEFGYNRRKQQQQQHHPVAGGNMGPKMSNSGDFSGYFNNKQGNKSYEQIPHQHQQQDMAGTFNKEAREYTNSSYKEMKAKPKNAHMSMPAPATDISAGEDVSSSSSKNVVISNKENVQTINVTITSTTTEKKSYAKERRAKGVSRPVEGAVMVDSADPQAVPVTPISGGHYQSLPPAGLRLDLTSPPLSASASHYRPQGMYMEPPPVTGNGSKLYNPSLPPPSFFQRDHGGLPPSQHPAQTPTGGVQDPTRFSPTLLPPTAALPFVLPVSSTGLGLPPNAAGIPANPALFQPPTVPPSAASIATSPAAMIAAPFLPAGIMYGGGPRVPPPGAPAAFPLTLAYTTPPPQGTVAAAVVGSQPPLPQGAAPAHGIQAAGQHKKVYRGDIIYYAPELQQPSRTQQKRPKAAIPIINPQEVPRQKVMDKSDQRFTSDKSAVPESKRLPGNNFAKTVTSHTSVTATSAPTLVNKVSMEGLEQKMLPTTGNESDASNSTFNVLPQGVSPVLHQSAASQSGVIATQANSSLVGHSGNATSASSHDGGAELKKSFKTELSPGGPPVCSSNTSPQQSKDCDQSLCAAMQNVHVDSKSEMEGSFTVNADQMQESK